MSTNELRASGQQRESIEGGEFAGPQENPSSEGFGLFGELCTMTTARDVAGVEFARFLVRFDRPLLRYIMTFIPRRDDAEEVLQRTATVLWEKFTEYDREREFLPWALRVAYFEVLNFRKQMARDRLVFREEVIEALAETRHAQISRLEAQRQALHQCLGELAAHDQTLLKRRYGDSETIAALADQRGKTAKALYRRLDRLREMIARCVERRMQLEGTTELA